MSERTTFLPNFSSLAVPRRQLMVILTLNFFVALAGFFALRILRRESPILIAPGQQLAQEVATAVLNSQSVTTASGGYVPEQGVILYTRMEESNPTFVRTWATNQLKIFEPRLAMLPDDETLTWVIDHGRSQEILTAPLTRASDPTAHQYVSMANIWDDQTAVEVVQTDVSEVAAVVEEPTSGQPVDEPPVETTEVITEPVVETVVEVAPVVEPVSAAPIVQAVSVPTQLVTDGFVAGAAGWRPLSGNWVVQDGVYIQEDSSGFDLITILETAPVSNFSIEARIQSLDGELGGGFIYGSPTAESRAGAQVVDLTEQGSFLRWGSYNSEAEYAYEGGVVVEPPIADGEWHTLRLVRNGEETTIFVDEQEFAVFTDIHDAGYIGLVTSQAQVQFDDVSVIQLPTINEEIVLLSGEPISADFNDGEALNWTPFAGVWEVVDGAYQQQEIEGFDFGTASDFQGQNYTLTADVRYIAGEMGGGFYFNMSQPNNKSGSQMINFAQGGTAVQWGYFNDAAEFVFTDFAPITRVDDGEWHNLQLVVNNGTATILLDDEIVADDITLVYDSGYVGLLSSQGQVAFDNVTVVPENILAQGETTIIDTLYDFDEGDTRGWLGFAGEWVANGGVYEQQQRNEWDRISSLNLRMNGSYSFGAEIRYVEGDMNGGLIFNMQQRDDKAQAHMVSFTAQGTFLQWGSFSEDGIFTYQNGIPINSVQDGEWHTLGVEVGTDSYRVLLDGVVVAAGVPLVYADGFVGLFGGQGQTAYDNVRLSGAAQSTTVDTVVTNEEESSTEEAASEESEGTDEAESEEGTAGTEETEAAESAEGSSDSETAEEDVSPEETDPSETP